eukprot:TRINITY_DN4401_c0_g1_i1.p1 TRINITY_DN4401_c0_g1~~TRINITY_DN4401_c0_g1_i1.p1  ORF type:complete len:763 (+),score=163.32 TRINITY_DN4401_c0_g1_i1:61-2349(+)
MSNHSLSSRLIVEYAGQEQNKIEKVERNKKMILHLSSAQLPEMSTIVNVPSFLQTDQKIWKKPKKATGALANQPERTTFLLHLAVYNEKNEPVAQCNHCALADAQPGNQTSMEVTNELLPVKPKSFILVRSGQVVTENKRIALPVVFQCCPSHQASRKLHLDICLIGITSDRVEFFARVPLCFKKHKKRLQTKSHPQARKNPFESSLSSTPPPPPLPQPSSSSSSPSPSPSSSSSHMALVSPPTYQSTPSPHSANYHNNQNTINNNSNVNNSMKEEGSSIIYNNNMMGFSDSLFLGHSWENSSSSNGPLLPSFDTHSPHSHLNPYPHSHNNPNLTHNNLNNNIHNINIQHNNVNNNPNHNNHAHNFGQNFSVNMPNNGQIPYPCSNGPLTSSPSISSSSLVSSSSSLSFTSSSTSLTSSSTSTTPSCTSSPSTSSLIHPLNISSSQSLPLTHQFQSHQSNTINPIPTVPYSSHNHHPHHNHSYHHQHSHPYARPLSHSTPLPPSNSSLGLSRLRLSDYHNVTLMETCSPPIKTNSSPTMALSSSSLPSGSSSPSQSQSNLIRQSAPSPQPSLQTRSTWLPGQITHQNHQNSQFDNNNDVQHHLTINRSPDPTNSITEENSVLLYRFQLINDKEQQIRQLIAENSALKTSTQQARQTHDSLQKELLEIQQKEQSFIVEIQNQLTRLHLETRDLEEKKHIEEGRVRRKEEAVIVQNPRDRVNTKPNLNPFQVKEDLTKVRLGLRHVYNNSPPVPSPIDYYQYQY